MIGDLLTVRRINFYMKPQVSVCGLEGIASLLANLHSRERSGKVTNFLHRGFETVGAGPDLGYSKWLVASLRGTRNVQARGEQSVILSFAFGKNIKREWASPWKLRNCTSRLFEDCTCIIEAAASHLFSKLSISRRLPQLSPTTAYPRR